MDNIKIDIDEAIKYLESRKKWGLKDKQQIVEDMAIEALKKRMPRKVKDFHHCPSCGFGLPEEKVTQKELREICRGCFNPNFCDNCGQAIDWGDEK